jgi:hypothetical protein
MHLILVLINCYGFIHYRLSYYQAIINKEVTIFGGAMAASACYVQYNRLVLAILSLCMLGELSSYE